jgi:hypothetical protein
MLPDEKYHKWLLGFLTTKLVSYILGFLNPTIDFQTGNIGDLPILIDVLQNEEFRRDVDQIVDECISLARQDWDSSEESWNFAQLSLSRLTTGCTTVAVAFDSWQVICMSHIRRMIELETQNNCHYIEAYGLQDELSPEVSEGQITLYRPDRGEDIKRLISYAIGCMMGRYSLDKPGLIYAHSGNKGFDHSQYQTFPADADGIIPLTEFEWFEDAADNRLEQFIATAWAKEYLEENLIFIAYSLGPNRNEQPCETIRRYLATGFYKHHLSMYKRRPIYWLFSSGKQRAFQCLVYLHRYHESTLSRMRIEYVIPLQGKIASRIGQLADDIAAASSTSHRKKQEKERDALVRQQVELRTFDEKLRHYADKRISLDLDDGVKINYGKFGDLLAEVKAVTRGTMDAES